MTHKQKDRSITYKILHMKYLGFVIVFGIGIGSGILFLNGMVNQEFFDKWSCDGIEKYLTSENTPKQIPTHDELTEKQHVKIHEEYQKCLDMEFSKPNLHTKS